MTRRQQSAKTNEIDGQRIIPGLERRTDQPAVAIVATPNNAEAVAGAVLRGLGQGYDTIVCHDGMESLEAVEFAKRLNASVVELDLHREREKSYADKLVAAARSLEYPGMLYHSEPEEPVDYEASVQQLEEGSSYYVDAIPRPTVRTEPEVLLAIPAYNEEKSIVDVVQSSRAYVDEVVVIDDGSSDATAEVAAEADARVIQHQDNKGYGAALATAFTEAKRCHASQLVILDGDGQHDPSDIPRVVEAQQESDAEIVIGSRRASGAETDMPLYRQFGFGVVNVLTNLSLGVVRSDSRVGDTQSGFRVYNRTAIDSLAKENIGQNMSASTDILHHAHRQGYKIEEVGIRISYDVEDANSHHPIRHGFQLVINIIRTIEYERPLSLLGIPGFIIALIGVGFAYWTIINYLSTGVFPVGMATVSGIFGLFGAFSCFTAIILHSLNMHRQ